MQTFSVSKKREDAHKCVEHEKLPQLFMERRASPPVGFTPTHNAQIQMRALQAAERRTRLARIWKGTSSLVPLSRSKYVRALAPEADVGLSKGLLQRPFSAAEVIAVPNQSLQ
jgi:hypothetical protein